MSTETVNASEPSAPVDGPLAPKELASLLVKHYGLHSGLYDLMIEYQLGTGGVGPDKDRLVPGVMIGIGRIGLIPAAKSGPSTVDAARINPPAKSSRKR